jgi:hypothetical protein
LRGTGWKELSTVTSTQQALRRGPVWKPHWAAALFTCSTSVSNLKLNNTYQLSGRNWAHSPTLLCLSTSLPSLSVGWWAQIWLQHLILLSFVPMGSKEAWFSSWCLWPWSQPPSPCSSLSMVLWGPRQQLRPGAISWLFTYEWPVLNAVTYPRSSWRLILPLGSAAVLLPKQELQK